MYVVTANIKSNPLMAQWKVDSDMAAVKRKGHVIFWQEIEPKRYKAALARVCASVRKRVAGIETESPVSYDERVYGPLAAPEVRLMHKGKMFVSPSRRTVVQKVHRLHRPTAPKVAFMGSHYVSGGWHKGFIHFRTWRKEHWSVHFEKMRAWIEELHAAGYTVVLGADFNRMVHTMPKFHKDQIIVSSHGIDGIIVVPAKGVRVETTHADVIAGLHTDHKPVVVGLLLHHA